MKPKITVELINLAIKKAQQSNCTYKISALGFNAKGDYIGAVFNKKSNCRHSINGKNGLHAEIELFKKYYPSSILILRTNNSSKLLPIHPCKRCKSILVSNRVRLFTIEPIELNIQEI